MPVQPYGQMTPGLYQQNIDQGRPGYNLGYTPWGNNAGLNWLTGGGSQHPLDNGVTQHAITGASMFPSAQAGYASSPQFSQFGGNRSYSPDALQDISNVTAQGAQHAQTWGLPSNRSAGRTGVDLNANRERIDARNASLRKGVDRSFYMTQDQMAQQDALDRPARVDPAQQAHVQAGQDFNQQYGGGDPLTAAVNYGKANGPAPMAQGPSYMLNNGGMGVGRTVLPNMNNRAGLYQPPQQTYQPPAQTQQATSYEPPGYNRYNDPMEHARTLSSLAPGNSMIGSQQFYNSAQKMFEQPAYQQGMGYQGGFGSVGRRQFNSMSNRRPMQFGYQGMKMYG